MQSLSKNDLTDLLRFVEQQIVFTIESTRNVSHYNNFLTSMEATILFNSTYMCLQTIGETIRQIDNRTFQESFSPFILIHHGKESLACATLFPTNTYL